MKKFKGLDKFNKAYANIIKESLDMGEKTPFCNFTEEEEQRLLAIGFKRGDECVNTFEGYLWTEDTEYEDYEARDVFRIETDAGFPTLTMVNALMLYSDYPDDFCMGKHCKNLDEFKEQAIAEMTQYMQDGKIEEDINYVLSNYEEMAEEGEENRTLDEVKADLDFAKKGFIKLLNKFKSM